MIKYILKLLFLLCLSLQIFAQDTVVTITPSMFDKIWDEAYLVPLEGWVFKPGTDKAWAAKELDVSDWKKLKPVELSVKDADDSGKLEGWFRIKIKLSDSIVAHSLDIKLSTWAASDLYVDGKLVASVGNTGANSLPYKEYNPYNKAAFAVGLKPGKEYTLALHMVDYVTMFPSKRLKSEDPGLNSLIRIVGPKYNIKMLSLVSSQKQLHVIWISVGIIISLLFWVLYIQNRTEKNLRLIAWGSSFFTLAMLFTNTYDISYFVYSIFALLASLFIGLSCIFTLLIVVHIFRRNLSPSLRMFLLVFIVAWCTSNFMPVSSQSITTSILMAGLIVVFLYYIFTSWKNLRGAQWAIVIGLFSSMSAGLVYTIIVLVSGIQSQPVFLTNLLVSLYALSFPLSLLVYISIRFKEIIKEVQQNAQKVVQLSEEKKQQAIIRQQTLQEEVNRQTATIQEAFDNLKATQTQLIQSEKMASLGELTAGIAHEIQNPLNFVNNFSEVSNELIDEMKEEFRNGETEEGFAIADDIKQNLEKIHHHGKRADAIVKGMLDHSRSSSGEKVETDINALCDEYLRLSYHGLRAKDKSFNASFNTDFDPDLPKINIVAQDIGRVLLNLINNAFYAVKTQNLASPPEPDYKPTVTVSTKNLGVRIEILINDNGNGIPEHIKDKIFQPFFTTKPTGQGTGLGLSLSYDIVKAHGGEIKVNTKENEGTEFTIQLPIFN